MITFLYKFVLILSTLLLVFAQKKNYIVNPTFHPTNYHQRSFYQIKQIYPWKIKKNTARLVYISTWKEEDVKYQQENENLLIVIMYQIRQYFQTVILNRGTYIFTGLLLGRDYQKKFGMYFDVCGKKVLVTLNPAFDVPRQTTICTFNVSLWKKCQISFLQSKISFQNQFARVFLSNFQLTKIQDKTEKIE